VFITAHRQRYPFDLAPSFWEQLVENGAYRIVIIRQVEKEIQKGDDILVEWYKKQRSKFTVLGQPGREVLQSYKKMINSIMASKQYTQSAKDEFASKADSWLCAYGLALGAMTPPQLPQPKVLLPGLPWQLPSTRFHAW
ncbi:MAG: DUF4411 family protein, partial [Firmicutes bacterium]|nr:DUF4411 family protein [Candidatus Fermentithermobacillaceae bacterium]